MIHLIKLTAREHFIAHWLLWRIHGTQKMAFAFLMMCKSSHKHQRYLSARGYEEAKVAMSISQKGKIVSQESIDKMVATKKTKTTKTKLSEEAIKKLRERTHTEETKQRMSSSHKGHRHSEESKKKMSDARKNIKLSKETREKISNVQIGRKASEETKLKMSIARKAYLLKKKEDAK